MKYVTNTQSTLSIISLFSSSLFSFFFFFSTSPEALMIPNFDYRNNICNNYGILDICTVRVL